MGTYYEWKALGNVVITTKTRVPITEIAATDGDFPLALSSERNAVGTLGFYIITVLFDRNGTFLHF